MIDKAECRRKLKEIESQLHPSERESFAKMCEDGISIGQLFRDEIPRMGDCTLNDALRYIAEESGQMSAHMKILYDMDKISAVEHVVNEQTREPEHAGLLYIPVAGAVKFFEEWLEGYHPSLGCMFGMKDQVPPDEYYARLAKGREEAREYR